MKVNNILEDALITLTRQQLSRSVLEVCQGLSLASRDTSGISTSSKNTGLTLGFES